MRILSLSLASAVVLGVFLPGGFAAAGAPKEESLKVDALFAAVAHCPGPGVAVLVVRDGKIVHEKGYGLANIEHEVPNLPQTKFRVGSITKSFTAIVILQLQERGLLSLDDTLSKYLPDYPSAERITIRRLLNHTSGIPGTTSQDQTLEFVPGSRISYSNTGYIVLGRVIEKICGKPYEAVLQENIFQPLGMKDTGYDHAEVLLKHRAAGYTVGPKGDVQNAEHINMAGPFAAGGLYSTVGDLYLFDQALYSEKLLKAATLEQAFTPTTLTDGRTAPYGLGWMVQPYRGLKEVAHGGDITGFNAYFARFPEQRYTVIVLSNLSMRPSGPIPTAIDLAHHIADVYLGDQMPSAEPPKVIEVDPKVLRTYAGQYRLAGPPEILEVTGDTLAVACEEGRLFIEAKQGRYEMVPESEKTFRILEFGTGVTFLRDDKGQVNEVIVAIMGLKELSATRIQ